MNARYQEERFLYGPDSSDGRSNGTEAMLRRMARHPWGTSTAPSSDTIRWIRAAEEHEDFADPERPEEEDLEDVVIDPPEVLRVTAHILDFLELEDPPAAEWAMGRLLRNRLVHALI